MSIYRIYGRDVAGAKAGNLYFKIGWPASNVIQMGILNIFGQNMRIQSLACSNSKFWLRHLVESLSATLWPFLLTVTKVFRYVPYDLLVK